MLSIGRRNLVRRLHSLRRVALTGLVITLFWTGAVRAAETRPRIHALTGATVVVRPGQVLENATVVLRDGLIEAVGTDVAVPPDAVVLDGTGKWIYAGLIDADVPAGTGPSRPASSSTAQAAARPATGAVHPLPAIRPEYRVRSGKPDPSKRCPVTILPGTYAGRIDLDHAPGADLG